MNKEYNFTIADLNSPNKSQWCQGCGSFTILAAIKKAIIELKLNPKDVLVISGIGCSSKLPQYLNTFGIESLHGRALPTAFGAKLANPNLHVIVVGGDGDGYGIGVGHLIHAIRKDINITYIVVNNNIYALTKGQTSPTTSIGYKTVTSPTGADENPINPIELSIGAGINFVAREYSGNLKSLTNTIISGIKHNGFSLIDVQTSCISYYPQYDFKYYKDKVYEINSVEDYDSNDKFWALKFLDKNKNSDKIPIGIYYQKKQPKKEYLNNSSDDINSINISDSLKEFE